MSPRAPNERPAHKKLGTLTDDPGGNDARPVDRNAAEGEEAATNMNPSPQHDLRRESSASASRSIAVTFSVSSTSRGLPGPVFWCDLTLDRPERFSAVPSSSGSPTVGQNLSRSAVTDDVTGAVARLATVRRLLVAAHGDITAAEAIFNRGLLEFEQLPMPFERALLELAYGQVLRRAGQRRAAASQLQAARDRLSALHDRPYLERCDRELAACGLTPAKRRNFDSRRLTAQETAVARLVATGKGNRQVATELFVSIKTVQFHLTHIYTKLGISSRGELAAKFRDQDSAIGVAAQTTSGQSGSSSAPVGQAAKARKGRSLPTAKRKSPPVPLTGQESAVAKLVAAGLDTRQVARELFIGIPTVNYHLAHIYNKLGIDSHAELVARSKVAFDAEHLARNRIALQEGRDGAP
jgi:DNA-binding CsgD family transcriptional regulator